LKEDEAIEAFRKVSALDPGNPEAHYMLGREMLNKGDTAGAIAEWRKTIEIQPTYIEALYNLARILAKSNPQEAARMTARLESQRTQQRAMDRAHLLGNFALSSATAHDWPQAVSQMKEAVSACGDCADLAQLHKDLGLIYCRSGNFSDGREELLLAQKLAPNDEDIRKSLQILATQ
jgi:Flp pilus assembly protein TadD